MRKLSIVIVSGWLVVLLGASLWFHTYAPSTEEVILDATLHEQQATPAPRRPYGHGTATGLDLGGRTRTVRRT